MTDIEQKAQALVDAVRSEYPLVSDFHATNIALIRNIEQHEAFRQEVSDALRDYYGGGYVPANSRFAQFIIPAPKPDPLDRVLSITSSLVDKETLRDRLKAEGLEIREKNQ